jgi:hypothetical protein
MALAMSIVALVLSAASFGWRIFEWYTAKHLDIVVTGNILELDKGGEIESFFVAKVHNRSAFSARVIGVTIESAASPPTRPAFLVGENVGLPLTIPPHDAEDINVPIFALKGDI